MIIVDQLSLEKSCKDLILIEPKFKKILDIHGLPRLRKSAVGFKALLKTIISQQLSVAAARNIWERFESNGFASLKRLKITTDSEFKSVGLSRQKINYVRSLATSNINYRKLGELDNHEIISQLTSIKGIGLWTAEIYLMFSMMRCDVFPAGDLALQVSSTHFLGLREKLNEKQMREVSALWSPSRTAAALMLWDYYGTVKNRKGIF